MVYNKETLNNLINIQKLSYREIGRLYGVSDAAIKKAAKKNGIILPVRANFPKNFIPHNKNNGLINCINCKNKTNNAKFCSKHCESEYKSNKSYSSYLMNQHEYCGKPHAMRFLKKHILCEQKNKCALCGVENIWNEKPLIFILDHIDGNASNNLRNNLRLICSNCDSQLDTYKSKNKNSARKERYLLNYK